MDLRELVTDAAFELVVGAVPATVTPKNGLPIECQIVWGAPVVEEQPIGLEIQRMTPVKNMSIRIADVPTLPDASVISAPELLDGVAKLWRVHGHLYRDSTYRRVIVIPNE